MNNELEERKAEQLYREEQRKEAEKIITNFEGTPEEFEEALFENDTLDTDTIRTYLDKYQKQYQAKIEEEEEQQEKLKEIKEIWDVFYDLYEDDVNFSYQTLINKLNNADEKTQKAVMKSIIANPDFEDSFIRCAFVDYNIYSIANANSFLRLVTNLADKYDIDLQDQFKKGGELLDLVQGVAYPCSFEEFKEAYDKEVADESSIGGNTVGGGSETYAEEVTEKLTEKGENSEHQSNSKHR